MTTATQPKPQREVQEETQETLVRLDQDRLPRPEKMARERSVADAADADEVRYAERAFHPRHPATLDEVRAAVDALRIERRALPEPRPVPPAAAPPLRVPDDVRDALAPAVPGRLVAAATRYLAAEGEVVEATWETEGGARASGLYLVAGGAARPLGDVAARIDALPEPEPEPAPAARDGPAPPAPSAARPADEAAPPPADAPATPTPPAPQKGKGLASRFGLGRSRDAPAPPAEAPAAPPPAPADEGAAASGKKRFSLRRK